MDEQNTASTNHRHGRTVALLFSVFAIATCGLIYELLAGTIASYVLGDSVTQFSTIIGVYLFSMGLGSYLSRYFRQDLIAVFIQKFGVLPDGRKFKHYYPTESVGLATGMLISAIHRAGLASLTHTPSPMKFLNEILGRPKNERPFLLMIVGYPADDAEVPDIHRRDFDESVSYVG